MEAWVGPIIQLVVALIGAGGLVQLLLVRANRRKLSGEAESQEVTAASTLSGAALAMVQNAQEQQALAQQRADSLQTQLDASRVENHGLQRQTRSAEWGEYRAVVRTLQLEEVLERNQIAVPPPPVVEIPQGVDGAVEKPPPPPPG